MKIHFTSTGGMLGVNRDFTSELKDIPSNEQIIINALLKRKDHYLELGSLKKEARDFMTYSLSIESEKEIVHFTFNDLNMPEEIDTLIAYCIEKSKVK